MCEDFQPAPLDLRAKLLTAFIVGLLLLLGRSSLPALLVLMGLLLLVVGVVGIRDYRLIGDELQVRHFGWSQRWRLRELRDVNVRPGAITGSTRTMGIGGFFGYIGRFRNQVLGDYQAYVTDGSRAVVLRFLDDTLVLSPNDPAAFVSKVYQYRAH
ncbi:MAG: PH domain-containing protein [Candidatus Promineifilaceae bacterium]|jgi:hypothetical protein